MSPWRVHRHLPSRAPATLLKRPVAQAPHSVAAAAALGVNVPVAMDEGLTAGLTAAEEQAVQGQLADKNQKRSHPQDGASGKHPQEAHA